MNANMATFWNNYMCMYVYVYKYLYSNKKLVYNRIEERKNIYFASLFPLSGLKKNSGLSTICWLLTKLQLARDLNCKPQAFKFKRKCDKPSYYYSFLA